MKIIGKNLAGGAGYDLEISCILIRFGKIPIYFYVNLKCMNGSFMQTNTC